MKIVRPISPSASRFVGSELDLLASYAITKNITFTFGYSHLFAGDYLAATGGGSDAHFVYSMLNIKF